MALTVDTDIPAGNAIVERVDGDNIHLRPDLRDTTRPWFYWHVRVRGCAGRTLRFHFTEEHTLTVRGAAVSSDAGWTRQINQHFQGRSMPIYIQLLDENSNDLDIDQHGLNWVSAPP